jgi:hypothetical protein
MVTGRRSKKMTMLPTDPGIVVRESAEMEAVMVVAVGGNGAVEREVGEVGARGVAKEVTKEVAREEAREEARDGAREEARDGAKAERMQAMGVVVAGIWFRLSWV